MYIQCILYSGNFSRVKFSDNEQASENLTSEKFTPSLGSFRPTQHPENVTSEYFYPIPLNGPKIYPSEKVLLYYGNYIYIIYYILYIIYIYIYIILLYIYYIYIIYIQVHCPCVSYNTVCIMTVLHSAIRVPPIPEKKLKIDGGGRVRGYIHMYIYT